jgi:hypothetical protein
MEAADDRMQRSSLRYRRIRREESSPVTERFRSSQAFATEIGPWFKGGRRSIQVSKSLLLSLETP